jgi:hypothetical protein
MLAIEGDLGRRADRGGKFSTSEPLTCQRGRCAGDDVTDAQSDSADGCLDWEQAGRAVKGWLAWEGGSCGSRSGKCLSKLVDHGQRQRVS